MKIRDWNWYQATRKFATSWNPWKLGVYSTNGINGMGVLDDLSSLSTACNTTSLTIWVPSTTARCRFPVPRPICQTLELQHVSEMLWSSEASPKKCLYPSIWRRFVQGLARCGHSKLEAAVNQVAATALPLVLRVPSLAEKEATHQKHEVLLNYEGHYFQACGAKPWEKSG